MTIKSTKTPEILYQSSILVTVDNDMNLTFSNYQTETAKIKSERRGVYTYLPNGNKISEKIKRKDLNTPLYKSVDYNCIQKKKGEFIAFKTVSYSLDTFVSENELIQQTTENPPNLLARMSLKTKDNKREIIINYKAITNKTPQKIVCIDSDDYERRYWRNKNNDLKITKDSTLEDIKSAMNQDNFYSFAVERYLEIQMDKDIIALVNDSFYRIEQERLNEQINKAKREVEALETIELIKTQ